MVKHNIKVFIYITLIIGFATYTLRSGFTDGIIKNVSFAAIVVFIFYIIFMNHIWKLRFFFNWLVPYPNLSGKWKGEMKSDWKKDEGGIPPIPCEIEIRQNFLTIQVILFTKESSSRAITSSFDIDKERGICRLIYSYQNEPKAEVQNRSQMHYGTVILNFKYKSKVTELNGMYWTSRNTKGDITLIRSTEN